MKRMHLFVHVFGLFVLLSTFAAAEPTPRPLLRTEIQTKVAVPGQTIVLDVTILVPTWMPKPPVFPSFELPDVSVRLPEGSSRPTMESVDGENWSGVTRAYQLSPMVVGRFRTPPQTVTVTYADPETRAPIVVELPMNAVAFEGRAPVGAEDLDPFIAAEALTIEQNIDGDPENLEPGSAFTRTVTARIEGASPIFLPPLVAPLRAEGLADYPKEPVFNERENRGRTYGERIESVTYVAEAGGRFEAEAIGLRWWNLRTKEIEVTEIPALEIVSRGPPPASPTSAGDSRIPVIGLGVGALCALIAAACARWSWPRFAAWLRRRREARLASESFAFEQVVGALRRQHYGDAFRAMEIWSARLPLRSSADRASHLDLLAPLGAGLYGREGRAPSKKQWSEAASALRALRRQRLAESRRDRTRGVLPALNPMKSSR